MDTTDITLISAVSYPYTAMHILGHDITPWISSNFTLIWLPQHGSNSEAKLRVRGFAHGPHHVLQPAIKSTSRYPSRKAVKASNFTPTSRCLSDAGPL
ncbi:hypothetical protein E4U42_007222 [Claviceps africana]|uniref:Uncharacterized protein n=1 Tax=Claviceps africana TaxID=83212 RepID=A0A8K0NK43_9HYPO|nr:hypothetical protein E4U42_007222 [Claviceps africana]